MKAFLMYFVILAEVSTVGLKKLGEKVNIQWIGFIVGPPLALYVATYISLIFGILVGVGFIIGGIILVVFAIASHEKLPAIYFAGIVALGFLYFYPHNSETLHEKVDVQLTEKNVKWKGYSEDVSCTRKDCKSNLYRLRIVKSNWLGITETELKVNCQVPNKTQEIQD